MEREILERWKRAVIPLECAGDDEGYRASQRRMDDLRSSLGQGKITIEEYSRAYSEEFRAHHGGRERRYGGTALFLTHERRRYLVTARHVVRDDIGAAWDIEDARKKAAAGHPFLREGAINWAIEQAPTKIFGIIFRVRSIGETISSAAKPPAFLMNLGAGSVSRPYSFSDDALDLAIIALDMRHNGDFADDLIALGYSPIPSDAISDGPESEGQEVFTVGYPDPVAQIGRLTQESGMAAWSSNDVVTPAFSFGRVSLLHSSLYFFWADMTVLPGNSGGPLVVSDQLAGIVTGTATMPIRGSKDGEVGASFALVTKGRFVRDLLRVQLEKEAGREEWKKRIARIKGGKDQSGDAPNDQG
jgi:hypothetical protein